MHTAESKWATRAEATCAEATCAEATCAEATAEATCAEATCADASAWSQASVFNPNGRRRVSLPACTGWRRDIAPVAEGAYIGSMAELHCQPQLNDYQIDPNV